MSILKRMNTIFCEVFDDDELVINPDMTANDIDGWDSLSHMNLVIAIEKDFKIRLNQKELLTLKNIGDLIRIIKDKIKT